MPGAPLQKSPPAAIKPQFITDFNAKEPEVKEEVRPSYSALNTNATIEEDRTGGAGETVIKKPAKKATKPDDDKIGKKVSASVSDKMPKKSAQRAKGTTSLNKTNPGSGLDKTKAASGDKVPASKEECVEKPKTRRETPDKKQKVLPRKPGSKVTKRAPKVPSPVVSEVMAESPILHAQVAEAPVAEDTIKVVNEEPRPTTTSSTHGLNCSFFERLHLGMKAYFNSRNSFICSDKNKKEGGNQTPARVGKGVKEDDQKTDPGIEFINNICISESDLLLDQLRLNSNLGGESSNFLTQTPKISQNLKRKKLKHCVRIQIPRKGYFYRSSMQFKIPGQPSSSPLELLEPCIKPKNRSKIEISGLAPTGFKVARVPVEKAVKKKRKPSDETDMRPLHSDAESFCSSLSGSSNWSTSPKLLAERDFDEGSAEKRRSGKNVPFSGERERERHSISENSFSADGQKKKKKTAAGVGGDCFEVLESERKTPTTLEALTNCISSLLGADELIHDLEITPVNPKSDTNLPNTPEESEEPSVDSLPSGSTFGGSINPTAVLMGEIDLHLELQNYLKAFNNFTVSKTRTKNTLHSNNPIRPEGNEFRTEELGDERKPGESATSVRDDANHRFFDESEERVESRLIRSQTQLSNILKQMQKTKSTEEESKGAFLTEKSIDSYEKIFPFGTLAPINNNIYFTGELATGNFWTDEPLETSRKVTEGEKPHKLPFNLQDMVEVYRTILEEYRRLQRRGRKPLKSLSFLLISLLNEKHTQKQGKKNLISTSKEISSKQGWKNSTKKMKSILLQEYVDVFQKILKSSMTIGQIARLNSIISSWESRSEEFITLLKISLEKAKKAEQKRKRLKAQEEMATAKEKPSSETVSSLPVINSAKPEVEPSSPSKSLQLMLESFFNSEGEDFTGLSHLKGKVLVDVKLAGSQIQVNDLSFVKKKIPPRKKADPDADGTSELIIESVAKSEVNDVLCEKVRENRQVKRRAKPKEKAKKKKEEPAEEQNTSLQFAYDEVQLRTQHPIDAILECSESKITEVKMAASDSDIEKKAPVGSDVLKKALESRFVKDFINKPNETVGEILSMTQELPLILKTRPAKTVRSLVDLKTKPAIWRKVRKTPSAWSRTFFCYSLQSPQGMPSKGSKKEKKMGGASKIKTKMQELALQRSAILKHQQPPDDSVLHLNHNRLTECCSMELLFSEKTPPKEPVGCGKLPGSVTNLPQDERREIAIDNPKSTVLFHSFNNSIDDRSFSLHLIHSDSFLRQFSQSSILQRDPKLLFKNSSDLKFRPVRVTDSKKDAKPFITFVLTPEQFEKADLPDDDVVIIQRKRVPVVRPVEKPPEEIKPELCHISVENFINVISTSNTEPKKKKRKTKTVERKFCPPSLNERKPRTRCQTCQLLSMQESQKKPSKKINTESRLTIKNNKAQAKKVKSENPKLFCLNKVANQNMKPCRNVREEKNKRQKLRSQSEETSNELKSKNTTEGKNKKEEAENFSKMSVNLEDIPLELLEALKKTIGRSEGVKKKKIISAIEKDMEKRQLQGGKLENSEFPKSFILEIHCKRFESSEKGGTTKHEEVHPKKKTEPLDSLEVTDTKGKDLEEEEESTYFDAVERNLKDDIGGAGEKMKRNLKKGTLVRPTTKNKSRLSPAASRNHPAGKSEEIILNQISDSLIEGQITYSLLLLDSFLKKKQKLSKENKPNNLNNLIQLVEDDTENLMTNLERNAWQKVLLILDALTQLLDRNPEETLKAHLQSTKAEVQKILQLNISRLDDLQKFNSSVTSLVSGKESDNDNAFGVIKQCLKHLRGKFALKGAVGEEENDSRQEVTKHNSNESVLSEIRDMKNDLVEELKSLENLVLVSDWGRSSSFFERTPSGANGSGRSGASSEHRLDGTNGCMHLMQCLMKDEDDKSSQQIPTNSSCSKSQANLNSAKSIFRVQKQKYRLSDRNETSSAFRNDCIYSSTSKTEPHVYINSVEDPKDRYKVISKGGGMKKGKIFSNPSFVMKECWKADEVPMKLIELFREGKQEEEEEEEETQHFPMKRMKLNLEDEKEKLSYTQEFHVLTEVQKAKILNVVEDTIKKLANNDFNEKWQGGQRPPKENLEENIGTTSVSTNIDRYFYKKFLLPWVFMKVVEMILCHLIQITFLSNNSFYERKSEFIPVIVTFYLTLLIVVISLVLHVSCYSCIGVQNPCYFMGVISSSVITLTTSSGIFVLLCSMDYYNSFREILVLLLISGLLCTLIAELCLFYVEVKNFWNMIGTTDQYYIP